MKHCHGIFSVFLVLCVIIPGVGQANYIGDIELGRPSPSWLAFNTQVHVSFSYNVTEPGGARFVVYPYADGQLAPGYGWQGSILYPQGEGTTSSFCTMVQNETAVDHIRVAMVSDDWNTTYLEIFLPVDYHFSEHGIHNIDLSYGSPSWLGYGQPLDIAFDYVTSESEVRIWARPYTDGNLSPGYSASGSPIHNGPNGSGTQYFHFTAGEAHVDEIRFEMWDPDETEMYLQFFVPVSYHWQAAHGLMNIETNYAPPQHLPFDEQIVANFDYYTSDANGVRIWAQPANAAGQQIVGGLYEGSPLEPTGMGSTDRYFFLNEGSADLEIHYIRLLMRDENQTQTYLDVLLPVFYAYDEHAVYNVSYDPGPPAILDLDERTDVFFDYFTTEAGGVRIFPRPFSQGGLSPFYAAGGSPAYPTGAGSADNYFTITQGATGVDECRFVMKDLEQTADLLTIFYPAEHYYAQSIQTPVFLSYFDLDAAYGEVTARWETSDSSEDVRFRLLREQGGVEADISWQRLPSGLCQAVDTDPVLLAGGSFTYRLYGQAAGENWELLRSENVELPATPLSTALQGNWPNPFNPKTTVRFTLAEAGPVRLTVSDVRGRQVLRLFEGNLGVGEHAYDWQGQDDRGNAVSSGIYFIHFEAAGAEQTDKMVLLR